MVPAWTGPTAISCTPSPSTDTNGYGSEPTGIAGFHRHPAAAERLLRPAAVAQPSARVRVSLIDANAEHVMDAHAAYAMQPGTMSRCSDTAGAPICLPRIGYSTTMQRVREKIGRIDGEAAIAISVVRSPEAQEQRSRLVHCIGDLEPLLAVYTQSRALGMLPGICVRCCSMKVRNLLMINHPISRAAARYHAASAGGIYSPSASTMAR